MREKSILNKLVIIIGPTASGKSDLGIKLAKKYRGEVISADSRQVYNGMDIGTGKVKRDSIKYKVLSIKGNKKDQDFYSEGIRHHLIDAASPKKQFTADDFKKLGEKAIKEVLANKKLPIIVGGTGFYIDILLNRMQVAQVLPNKKLRAELEEQSAEQLFRRLSKLDPRRASNIDQYNKRRLVRALEIVISTGKPVPDFRYEIQDTRYKILWLGLNPKNLQKRIKNRLDTRLDSGMINEVKNLHKQGVSWKRIDDFGLEYRWISRWLRNTEYKIQNTKYKDSDEYRNLMRDIIRYSKRQMTWFKRNKDIKWIKSYKEAEKSLELFLRSRL